ncbi:hypothetical protein BH23THE1_BH23THE1_30520 [soil metagenome]
MNTIFIKYLIKGKRFILLAVIEIILFFLYFFIVSPSNFGSFSDTLRYYISALGTVLAVVVSFNTLALQNQMKNMPGNLSQVHEQIDKTDDLLKPILQRMQNKSLYKARGHNNGDDKNHDPNIESERVDKQVDQNIDSNEKSDELKAFQNATENFTDAFKSMIIIVKDTTNNIFQEKNGDTGKKRDSLQDISEKISTECTKILSAYEKTNHLFAFILMSTTPFIQGLKFNVDVENDTNAKTLYESLKRLHVLKSIGYSIFVRNTLADLSKELLVSSIPIITFIGLISSISNYETYDIFLLRVLFAISISIAAIPFMLLFIRTLPILHLIKTSSTIPYSRK